ncbi:hypothetical protein [Roseibium sediminis]|uniref:hypothetical protein n=1 Tax=Roseibium sediminis TaxID=1775174 RepID=UPI00123CBFD5|nr:hypothetical protein [Roseibium sediminis]
MNNCRNCELNRSDLTERAFAGCEIAKAQEQQSLSMAEYAESIGALLTAEQLRLAAEHFSRAGDLFQTVIRKGYQGMGSSAGDR